MKVSVTSAPAVTVCDVCKMSHLAVIQLAELLDDPLLQDQSLPQLLPVVLDGHFALFPLDRVVPGGDGAGPLHAANSGRTLEEDAAADGWQRGAGLGAGGRHVWASS